MSNVKIRPFLYPFVVRGVAPGLGAPNRWALAAVSDEAAEWVVPSKLDEILVWERVSAWELK